MTGFVFGAILCAALLHAAWNALIKSGVDKALDTALVHGIGTLVAVPLVAFAYHAVGPLAPAAWPWLIASVLIHFAYYAALAAAYRHGDLSLAYPLMRGSAPLLVALAGVPLLGERLSPQAWAGVLGISLGVLALGLSAGARRPVATPGSSTPATVARPSRAVALALANAVVIALYTIVDGLGVRAAGNAWLYVGTLFLLDGLPYLLFVLWRRGPRRGEACRHMARRWPLATLGALASLGSYAIALWAMTQAPVATVAALRETSVLFAALIGVLLLREPFGWRRAAGTLVILAGVMTLRAS